MTGQDISNQKDEEIVILVQSGKIDLFKILIERYEEKIKRYVRKFLASKEDINDVVQSIFIKAYVNIQSFDSKRKFSSWLYRIAHNESINVLKKKTHLPLIELDVFVPHSLRDNSLEQDIEREDMRKTIDHCLDQLEPKYREPIILYYFEELSYKEISDVMKIPVSTVGVRIKRAKEILRKNGIN